MNPYHKAARELLDESREAWAAGNSAAAVALAHQIVHPEAGEEALLFAGWILSSQGEVKEAVAAYRLAGRRGQLSAEQHRYLGHAALAAGDAQQALADFEAAANRSRDPRFTLDRAVALNRLERWREAAAACVALILSGERSLALVRELAVAAAGLRRWSLAILCARRAIFLDPAEPAYALDYVSTLIAAGRLAEASDALATSLATTAELPPIAAASYFRSILAAQEKNFGTALEAIDNALALAPENPDYVAHRAGVLGALGRFDEAAELYLQILDTGRDDDAIVEAAFAALTEAGQHLNATRVGAILVARRPGDNRLLATLQHVLGRQLEFGHSGRTNAAFAEARAVDGAG